MIIVRLTIGTKSESVALGLISHSAPSFSCAAPLYYLLCIFAEGLEPVVCDLFADVKRLILRLD